MNCWATSIVLVYLQLKYSDKATILQTIIRKSEAYLSMHNVKPSWNDEANTFVKKLITN
jgi:hypothetical protein